MKKILTIVFLTFSQLIYAQIDSTEVLEDYSQYGEVDGVIRYCTQKVLNQTPQRIISLGYEYNAGFHMSGIPGSNLSPQTQEFHVNQVNMLRAQLNLPVIATNKLIWQLGANFWTSKFDLANNISTNPFANALQKNALLSTGINSTIFRPLNDRNFLIFQGSIDVNGIFPSLSDINSKAVTLSATGIYGWKKSESDMIGVGIARTYRAGRLIYVPVLLWNKTFNDRWGMELLLPAKGFVRYNFSTSSMLQLGFELEGNQFYSNLPQSRNGAVYIQRGEFKPRIMWDKKLTGFLWLNVQAGLRYNYRFDVMDKYDGKDDTERFFAPTLGNPLYLNFSLNFVSP
jgi:Domain of unknown function (DUF6268)